MKVLVVEDSLVLQKTLGLALGKSGYSVDVAGDGEEGLWMAETGDYDAIVLDWMLPKKEGIEVMRELRAKGKQVHVLMLTARDAVEERVRGLGTGADDYLVKPFAMEELLARVDALCRRSYQSKEAKFEAGGLRVDFGARSVLRDGERVELTPREYRLLEYLVRRKGQVVSRAEIEEHIYDERADPMSNVVDSAVCSLRRKIAGKKGEELPAIRTRRGLGYVFEEG